MATADATVTVGLQNWKIPAFWVSSKSTWKVKVEKRWRKSFKKVIIHTRCKQTAYEFREYSYKKDRLTDEVLPIVVDKDNHYIDALRYALEKIMKRKKGLNIRPDALKGLF